MLTNTVRSTVATVWSNKIFFRVFNIHLSTRVFFFAICWTTISFIFFLTETWQQPDGFEQLNQVFLLVLLHLSPALMMRGGQYCLIVLVDFIYLYLYISSSGVILQFCTASDLSMSDHKLGSKNVSLILSTSNSSDSISCSIKKADIVIIFSNDSLPNRHNLSTSDEWVSFCNSRLQCLPLKTLIISFSVLFFHAPHFHFHPIITSAKVKGCCLEHLIANAGLVVDK